MADQHAVWAVKIQAAVRGMILRGRIVRRVRSEFERIVREVEEGGRVTWRSEKSLCTPLFSNEETSLGAMVPATTREQIEDELRRIDIAMIARIDQLGISLPRGHASLPR